MRHGCNPHHAGHGHAGHNIHAGHHNMHGAHHIHNTHPGPFQSGPFRSGTGPFQGNHFRGRGYGYGTTFYSEQHRPILKFMSGVGIFLLTVSVILIFCGILNFAGVIPGETFSKGVPMLGFGGILFLAGIAFTIISCLALKQLTHTLELQNQGQMTGVNVCPPSEQLASNVQYDQSSGQAEYNQSSGKSEFSQPPGGAAYGQPPGNAGYGQPPGNAGYGQPPGNAGYGQPPGNAGYGQPPGNAGYGQPPGNAGYGQPPGNAAYGQPPGNPAYGQPPGNVQSNWSYPISPLPASAPPPYAAAAVYPDLAPGSSTQGPNPEIGFVSPGVTNP